MYKPLKTISGAQLITESKGHFKVCHFVKWPLCIQFRIACAALRRHFRASESFVRSEWSLTWSNLHVLWSPRVITAVIRANYWTLSWVSWIHTYFHAYFWRIILMLFSHLRPGLPRGLFVFEFSV